MVSKNDIYQLVTQASTNEDWRELNNLLHCQLEQRMEVLYPGLTTQTGALKKKTPLLDTDEKCLELNALCTMTQEIISMRTLASKILTPRSR